MLRKLSAFPPGGEDELRGVRVQPADPPPALVELNRDAFVIALARRRERSKRASGRRKPGLDDSKHRSALAHSRLVDAIVLTELAS